MPAQILPMLDTSHQELAQQNEAQQQQYHQQLLQLQQNKFKLDAETERQLNPLRQAAMQQELARSKAATDQTLWETQRQKAAAPQQDAQAKAVLAETQARTNLINDPTQRAATLEETKARTAGITASTEHSWAEVGKAGVDALNSTLNGISQRAEAAMRTKFAASENDKTVQEMAKQHVLMVATLATEEDPQKREILANSAATNKLITPQEAKSILSLPVGDYSGVIAKDLNPMAANEWKSIQEQIKNFRSTTDNEAQRGGNAKKYDANGNAIPQTAATETSARKELNDLYAKKAEILKRYLDVQDLKKADFSHAKDGDAFQTEPGKYDTSKMDNFGLYTIQNPKNPQQRVPVYNIDGRLHLATDPKTIKLLQDRE